MHRSRLAGFIIDCETPQLGAAARFWGGALGATRVSQVETWWVMQAPTGQKFCVVRAESPGFEASANAWP